MKEVPEKLNPEQLKAVKATSGPLLIVAGAGTGKTKVIVEKIKYLLHKKLAQPEEILALTFTEKAAYEMQERVDQAVPYGYFQMWISTFHGFADQLLQEYSHYIGINRRFKLMTQAETIIFFRKNLFLFDLHHFRPLGNPGKFIEDLIKHFDRLKDENISPEEYLKWIKTAPLEKEEQEQYLELGQTYQRYQDLKIKSGFLDFSDLAFYLVKILEKKKSVLKELQNKFHYVLVDEFQDTNIVQYLLIKLLCPPENKPNLTIVGDDSQAIYKFRGASVSNILNFIKDYPQSQQITLSKNYRSNQEILNIAYKLIQNNNPDTLETKLGISKKLIANNRPNRNAVDFQLFDTGEGEADFVASKIKELIKAQSYQYQDIAILVRANNQLEAFGTAFQRQGIPYQLFGPGILFKQAEVKDLIAYLKVLYNIEDSVSLYRTLSMEIFNLDQQDLLSLLNFSKKTNQPLYTGLKIYLAFFYSEIEYQEKEIYQKYLPLLKKETQEKLYFIYVLINKNLLKINKDSAGQLLYVFLEESKYLNRLVDYKTERDEKIALNISKFFSILRDYENSHEDASVFTVVDYLEISLELGESPSAAKIDATRYNAVNLLTVHSAKGLEFPVVFLVSLVNNRFPTNERKEVLPLPDALVKEILPEGNYHLQEERRLFYVGITRAKNQLFLTAAKYYNEGKRIRKISQFVYETINQKYIEEQINLKKQEKEQLTIFDFKKKPETFVKTLPEITTFSFTQLDTFLICPLQYKYQYLIKIPTPPSAAMSFGTTIHNTLLKYYRLFQTDKQIDKKTLLKIFKEEWIPLGYSSLKHQEQMQKTGVEILEKYYATFHSSQLKIIDLEKPFKIKIAPNVFLTGKIDRVNQLEKKKIEIVDYKTGKKPSEKDILNSLQLSIYALAAHNKSLYGKDFADIELSFYYLQNNEKISLQKDEKESQLVMQKILETVTKIQTSKFPHKKGIYCKYCPFRIICPAWQQ